MYRNSFQIFLQTFIPINLLVLGGILLSSCGADGEHPGYEYAPQMYHSIPYEPLSQIKDKEKGRTITSRAEGPAEHYNSNPYNPYQMTMREPVPGTVKRREGGYLPYTLPQDSLVYAAENLVNPVPNTEAMVAEGKALYERFCRHCHGAEGQGDGLVGKIFKGVPIYNSRALQNVTEGHIFHVISKGKGRMGAHESQISQEERWKIVHYVQVLQKK